MEILKMFLYLQVLFETFEKTMKKSFGKNSHASNKIFRDSATNLFQSFFHYFNNLEFLFHSFFQKEVSTKKLKNFHSFSSFYQILLAISIISFFYVTPVFSKLSHVDGVLNKNKYHYSNGKATFDEIGITEYSIISIFPINYTKLSFSR